MSNARKPADRKPKKAVERLRDEASAKAGVKIDEALEGHEFTLEARSGEKFDMRIAEMGEWDSALFDGNLDQIGSVDLLCMLVSYEDEQVLRAHRWKMGSLTAALLDEPDDGELPAGESSALQVS